MCSLASQLQQPHGGLDRPSTSPEAQRDLYRDSLLRYSAFTSDLGESFKPFISRRLYFLSYGVVAAYGLADTIDKGRKAYAAQQQQQQQQQQHEQPITAPAPAPARLLPAAAAAALGVSERGAAGVCADAAAVCLATPRPHLAGSAREQASPTVPVAAAVLDSALWHGAASIAIPGVLINRAVWASGKLLGRLPRLPPPVRAFGPSAIGLALIPLVVPHVDEGVSAWMDKHVRPHLSLAATADS